MSGRCSTASRPTSSEADFLGQLPTFGNHLAPSCNLWLHVVVNTRPRPHHTANNGFCKAAKPGEGSNRSFKPVLLQTCSENGPVYPSM